MKTRDVAQAIYLATKDKTSGEISAVVKEVTVFLARKRLLSKSPEILANLEEIINKAEGRMVVHIKSVAKITEETKKEITAMLKKHYQAHEFVFRESIDSTLLGGVRIEIGNDVIDLSTKNKIGQLKDYLEAK
jgi:F-type H+-transporting ATPase subunit delta